MTVVRRVRLVAAWLLGLYFARMYVSMGWVKFDPHGFWTAAFIRWGYPPWFRVLIGALEVAGGVALIVPWLASYGGLAVCAVMIGAWGTRAHDHRWVDVQWITLYVIGLLWIAYEWWWLRLGGRKPRTSQASTTT